MDCMDLQKLSSYLVDFLVDNDRVSFLGLGSFVAENSSAFFSGDGKTLFPPSRKLTFRQQESWDDGMLVYVHQRKTGKELSEVQAEMAAYAKQLLMELRVKKILTIPGIGDLKETKEGNIYFVPDVDLDLNTEGLGLPVIPIKELDQNRAAVRERARQMQDLLKEAALKEATQPGVEAKAQQADESNTQPEEDVPVPSIDETPIPEPVVEDEETQMETKRRHALWLVWILVFLVVVGTLVLFWPSIETLFDGWLYSEEELHLINSRN